MPTVKLLFDVKRQFFDDNGVPLAGGKLYTYQAGTNTAKATYSDAEGATLHANPVVLDSAGRTTVYGDGSYKVVLKDADNVTIWTQDNILTLDTSYTVDTMAELRALSTVNATTARTKGYYDRYDQGGWEYYWDSTSVANDDGGMVIQPLSAPVQGRWLGFPPINGMVDARMYGCKLDGVTNDLAALQKCDEYCSTNKITIYFQGVLAPFSTALTLNAKIRFSKDSTMQWSGVNPSFKLSPDVDDNSGHFICSAADAPILDTPYICPEWFYENASSHPKTTNSVDISFSSRKMIFTGIIATLNAEMN